MNRVQRTGLQARAIRCSVEEPDVSGNNMLVCGVLLGRDETHG
jgi:hypothetical protein